MPWSFSTTLKNALLVGLIAFCTSFLANPSPSLGQVEVFLVASLLAAALSYQKAEDSSSSTQGKPPINLLKRN